MSDKTKMLTSSKYTTNNLLDGASLFKYTHLWVDLKNGLNTVHTKEKDFEYHNDHYLVIDMSLLVLWRIWKSLMKQSIRFIFNAMITWLKWKILSVYQELYTFVAHHKLVNKE